MSSQLAVTPAATSLPDQRALAALLVQSDLIALALLRDGALLFANAAFRRLFGQADGLAGTPLATLVAPPHRDRLAAALRRTGRDEAVCVVAIPPNDNGTIEVELHARALIADGETLCAIFAQDVTDRSRATARLNLLAFSDPLTGLANRALFADRLRQAVLDARRNGDSFFLLMLDLDGFKPINDRHGHAMGDMVLQQVAGRLQAGLRATETIARLGGDEFAVLLRDIRHPADATGVANRLLAAIRQPIEAGALRIAVTASAGIATFPDHGGSVEHLLVAADTALYAAKRAGGGRCAEASGDVPANAVPPSIVWTVAHELGVPEMDAQHARMAALLNALAEALHNGQDPRPGFGEFVRYAAFHFACEERLMAKANYPAAGHCELHRQLLAEVSAIAREGEAVSASLLLRYLQEWLFRHVDGADRELAAALLAR